MMNPLFSMSLARITRITKKSECMNVSKSSGEDVHFLYIQATSTSFSLFELLLDITLLWCRLELLATYLSITSAGPLPLSWFYPDSKNSHNLIGTTKFCIDKQVKYSNNIQIYLCIIWIPRYKQYEMANLPTSQNLLKSLIAYKHWILCIFILKIL